MTHSNSPQRIITFAAHRYTTLHRCVRALQSLTCLFTVGGLYALAVYTAPVDVGLPGVWATSLGLMHWLSAPVSILIGLHLDSHGDHNLSPTQPNVRPIAMLSSMSYVMFALAAYAVANGMPLLLRLAISCQALPLGISTFFFHFSFFLYILFLLQTLFKTAVFNITIFHFLAISFFCPYLKP